MIKIESFGIVPLKREDNEWKVLLILHRAGNHWGFPYQGKANADDEQHLQAARRELKEETNLDIKEMLRDTPFIEHYQFRRKSEQIYKTAFYFPAMVEGELICQEEEIRDAKWCSLPEALAQLSFKQARHILCEIMRYLHLDIPGE